MLNKIIKINLIIVFSFFMCVNYTIAESNIDSITSTENLNPFDWEVISGVDDILKYDNTNSMSKNARKKLSEGNDLYVAGVNQMSAKNYAKAIELFSEALKKYKRSKISEHAYNYIYINMSLSYANIGTKKDNAVAARFISLVTSKVDKEKNWLYNLSIANNLIGDHQKAIENLSQSIRLDVNYFQAYITLEAIYRNNNNKKNADKVRDRMESAEAFLIKKHQKEKKKREKKSIEETQQKMVRIEGVRPDIKHLNIVKEDDNLQYNKVSQIKERSMKLVQEGVGAYNNGVDKLSSSNYAESIEQLITAEKKLKRGKISEHGLNFSRGNLSIAYLCMGERSKLGQVKRNLRNITSRLYQTRDWTYNMAVVNYSYGIRTIKGEKGSEKWMSNAKKSPYIKESIRLMKLTIKHDKLFLDAYKNLVYIYKELEEDKKAEKYYKLYDKRRNDLISSFDREEQIKQGVDGEYVFRIFLGTFEEYEPPADMFDEKHLITVPINERKTAYLCGMFYNLNNAKTYLKKMIDRGYEDARIRAYRDGERINF